MFSNEHINYLITYTFNFRNEELLSYYISFLRFVVLIMYVRAVQIILICCLFLFVSSENRDAYFYINENKTEGYKKSSFLWLQRTLYNMVDILYLQPNA